MDPCKQFPQKPQNKMLLAHMLYPRDMQLPSWYGSAKKRQHDMGGFMLGNMIGTCKQGNDRQHGKARKGG